MTSKEVLLKAAALIDERGHTQGASERDGKLCIVGALDRSTAEPEPYEGAAVLLKRHLGIRAHDESEFRSIVAWNDAPGRTAAEVVAALRGAAESCQ